MLVSYTASGDTFVASTPRVWTQKNDFEGFDLAPDGKRFVVVQRTEITGRRLITRGRVRAELPRRAAPPRAGGEQVTGRLRTTGHQPLPCYNRVRPIPACPYLPGLTSARMKCSRLSARAAWARSIAPAIPD